jgi:hypothetical protein
MWHRIHNLCPQGKITLFHAHSQNILTIAQLRIQLYELFSVRASMLRQRPDVMGNVALLCQ